MRRKKYIKLSEVDHRRVAFRFWCRTQRCGRCIEWQGGMDKDGYGKVSVWNSTFRASRLAYLLFYGRDPGEKLVLHRCDNTRCVNPRHLFVGTQKRNIRDMDSRGRRTAAKLTWAAVRFIRRSSKSAKELAVQFNVTRSCIYHVRLKLTWAHVI